MKPFDNYPEGGATILKKMGRNNARREDGLWLMLEAEQKTCVYCEISLVDDYYHWLLLNVGHVISPGECARLGIPTDWHHSFSNAVLTCSGCNTIDSVYQIEWQEPQKAQDWTAQQFIDLRDRVFEERKKRILERRDGEVSFFNLNVQGQ